MHIIDSRLKLITTDDVKQQKVPRKVKYGRTYKCADPRIHVKQLTKTLRILYIKIKTGN